MSEHNRSGEIRAAGGVVIRGRGTELQVLLVHRPAFDDWTLPKGKVKRNEDEIGAALREVAEETGLTCAIGVALGDMHYFDRKGRAKVTRYWAMSVTGGEFRPTSEVDACEWLAFGPASIKATRSGERDFLSLLSQRVRQRQDSGDVTIDEPIIIHEQPW
jgi:8-oxo-dGTP diphosphatase